MFGKKEPFEKNELLLHRASLFQIFLRQLKNPLLLILAVATLLSFFLGERSDSLVIFSMVALSIALGFWNEFTAERTVSDLLKKVSLTATVIRNGEKMDIPARDLVVGDIVLLSTGSIIPADLQLTNAKTLEIDESILTGEALPKIKSPTDQIYMGTAVISGSATGEVFAIGSKTKFGSIATSLTKARPETEFQKGLQSFGFLLLKIITIMVVVIFLVNSFLGHPIVQSMLFSLAIAIGLTPELLPVVVTVSLSHGARHLAKQDVIVKQLVAIENLGNMEVLCTDKTGTLTEGKISLVSYFDKDEKRDDHVLNLGLYANSAVVHHRIFGDSIDTAIWEYARTNNYLPPHLITKVAEEPFDYNYRAMFTVIDQEKDRKYLYKGAPEEVLNACKITPATKKRLVEKFKNLSRDGFRVVALAEKDITIKKDYSFKDATGLTFAGFLTFTDTPKKSAKEAIDHLEKLGVKVKIVTGDNELVTAQVCQAVGIPCKNILFGKDIDNLTDSDLQKISWQTDAFVHVSPDQKMRIVNALKSGGHTVGYLGDGVNDSPALHVADVAISVNTAVDVAKDTASIVLLRKSLSTIASGITEGRRTFNNTVKYILMGTSSNFGNMFSAAGASFVLPFLPMSPAQILLTNSLYDISQLAIPTDNVDPEALVKPRGWDLKLIKRYMLFFGPISSLYDFLTFGVMLFVFKARGSLFQTGWFIESLITEILVIFVVRTTRIPFTKSSPSKALLFTCLATVLTGVLIPFIKPLANLFGLTPPPPLYFVIVLTMTITYLLLVEIGKSFLNKSLKTDRA